MRPSGFLLLALLLAASATLLLVEPSDARTIIVDDDWSGADYDTIRAAIAAASEGDTIRVYDGTYNEANSVGKRLDLVGNGTGTVIDGTKMDHVFGFSLMADGCNVSNFKFCNWWPTHHFAGISIESGGNAIFDNLFYYNLQAVYINGGRNNLVCNNTFDRNKYGILVPNGANDNNISFNRFTRNTSYGILYGNSRGVEVFSNTFENYTSGAIAIHRSDNCSVSFNMFEVADTTDGNRFGITVYDVIDTRVHNNTFIRHGIAVLATATLNLRVEHNTIAGGEHGIRFMRAWNGPSYTGLACRGTVMRQNDFHGQSVLAVNATPNEVASIDARHNWWGDATGPYHQANNTRGKGPTVTDLVDFDPWLGARVVHPPIAFIREVRPGHVTEGEPVTFLGVGLARNRTDSHVWRSSIDGELHSGPGVSFTITDLSVGTHTIRLVVRDRCGLWSDGVITTLVVNGRPHAIIDGISPSTPNEGDDVSFEGSYTDAEDDIKVLVWESDIDGMLSSRQAFTTGRLSNGTHNITFRVMDGHGAWSETARATVTVNGVPRSWIESIEPGLANEAAAIIFRGGCLDHEGEVAACSWQSDIDGTIGDQRMFSTSSLSNGTHNITFRVMDGRGVWSGGATGAVTINGVPWAIIGSVEPCLATEGGTVRFLGGFDDHEGRVDAFEWRSDLDGVLSYAKDFTRSDLTAGTHVISFTVWDHLGVPSEPATALLVVDGRPRAFIDHIGPDPVNEGEAVTFRGRAEDPESDVREVVWESDIDGTLATVLEFTTSTLSPGTHTITLRVRDGVGAWSDDARATVTVNGLPSASIVRIDPAAVNEGEEVRFEGGYADPEGEVAAFEWTSDLDGLLSDLRSFATSSLSNGTHTISLRVRDRQETWSPPVSASLSVNGLPRATILPTVPERVLWGDVVAFEAEAFDDGTIMGYHWTSSIDGSIGEGPRCSRGDLSVGHHTIALRVVDDAGAWSGEVRIELTVEAPPVELTIEDILFMSPAREGEGVSIVSHVRNVGRGDVLGITVLLRLDGEVAGAGIWEDPLAPGSSLEARFEWKAVQGTHVLLVEVLQGDVVVVSTVSDTDLVVDPVPATPTEDGGDGVPGAVYRLSEPPLVHLIVLSMGVVLGLAVYATVLFGGRTLTRGGRGVRPR